MYDSRIPPACEDGPPVLPPPRDNPKPNDVEIVFELEYGYASRSFFAAWFRALRAVSNAGRGIRCNTSGFRDGWDCKSDDRIGRRDEAGRLAD